MDSPSLHFGTNISHWLSQSTLDRQEMGRFFTREDVERIASWGMDHIRFPVDYPLIENEGWPGCYSEEGLSWVDRALDWCEAAGLWFILDMHVLPGHLFFMEYRGINTIFDPVSPTHKRAVDLWRMLAHRYKGRKIVFEILNEPTAQKNGLWNDFAARVHAAIRSEAMDRWIMVSGNDWGHVGSFTGLSPVKDDKTVYTFHFYEPLLFTHQNAPWVSFMKVLDGTKVPYPGPFDHPVMEIKSGFPLDFGFMKNAPYGLSFLESLLGPVLQFKEHHRVPVYCGEFGTVVWSPPDDRIAWYRDVVGLFSRYDIGFANWDYKSDDFGVVKTSGAVDTKLLTVLQNAAKNRKK
jgi:hypothetical protein